MTYTITRELPTKPGPYWVDPRSDGDWRLIWCHDERSYFSVDGATPSWWLDNCPNARWAYIPTPDEAGTFAVHYRRGEPVDPATLAPGPDNPWLAVYAPLLGRVPVEAEWLSMDIDGTVDWNAGKPTLDERCWWPVDRRGDFVSELPERPDWRTSLCRVADVRAYAARKSTRPEGNGNGNV